MTWQLWGGGQEGDLGRKGQWKVFAGVGSGGSRRNSLTVPQKALWGSIPECVRRVQSLSLPPRPHQPKWLE